MQARGRSMGRTVTRESDNALVYEYSLPAGNAGELTTRTSDTAGEVTADSASHTIETGDTVDVHWDGGVRYGMTVGTVSGTAIPISGGSGDNLPSASTGVVVTEQVVKTCHIDGDNVQMLGIESVIADDSDTTPTHVQFVDSGDAEVAELDLTPGDPSIYDIAGGDSNPFTGNPITQLKASNGSSDNAATLTIISAENSA